ncbi:DUF6879 family protein [Streptomyces sp. NPDC059578]|uniref:DUF6879 family protein n=1 Tax=Streptomyces sp. NPDC059578 TaxID=3346874 RepID=UPI00367F4C70
MTTLEDEWSRVARSAVHLETRDNYAPGEAFCAWRDGRAAEAADAYRGWADLMRAASARGVVVRRARIVSEPVSEYVRFEHDVTGAVNLAGGELVRWLPRRLASDLLLPGNDFWIFDGAWGKFNHFAGDGGGTGPEPIEDPRIVEQCLAAFEAVWQRATPHEEYKPV